MVKAMVNIDEHTNRVLNIVKAKYDLKNKSQAIDLVTIQFEEEVMEPELRPEFVEKMKIIQKEKTIPVKDFEKRYGLK